jgi:hypothetical protein
MTRIINVDLNGGPKAIRYRYIYETNPYARITDGLASAILGRTLMLNLKDVCIAVGIDPERLKKMCPFEYITHYWFDEILDEIGRTPEYASAFGKLATLKTED